MVEARVVQLIAASSIGAKEGRVRFSEVLNTQSSLIIPWLMESAPHASELTYMNHGIRQRCCGV